MFLLVTTEPGMVCLPGGMAGGMAGSQRAAEAQHCERTGEVTGEGEASGAVKAPRLKGSRREAEVSCRELRIGCR